MSTKGREKTDIFHPKGLAPHNLRPPLHPDTKRNSSGKSFKGLSRGESVFRKIPFKMEDIEDLREKWGDSDSRLIELEKEQQEQRREREEKERKEKKEQRRKTAEKRHQNELNKRINDPGCSVSGGIRTRKNKSRKNKRAFYNKII
jgi:hypothetical protein